MGRSPAILVRDLRKSYGLKAAVDGVDLEVPRGSIFGFLGPNGAGKSTTIRILTGLIPADAGTIEILGFKLPEDELEIKKRIGLVPEGLDRIFNKFEQLGQASVTGEKGTGLGLSVSDSLVRAAGGRITFAGEPGKGASFEITLPAAEKVGSGSEGTAVRAGVRDT